MAKKHKNLDNIPIQWDGDLSKPSDGSAQSAPDNIDITWGGYVPCWYPDNYTDCVIEDMYFEDFDIASTPPESATVLIPDGVISVPDINQWVVKGRGDIATHISNEILVSGNIPPKAPKNTYTWGDVNFVIEIADGIGTGNRRAREARIQQFDKDKKKRLIRLICRVKGEKVYDEEKEVGDTYIKLEDAELVINEVLGKIKVEKADVL